MNICVYCSSCDAIADEYKRQARKLGSWIADKGHTLVYGGATGGLMDAVAEGAHEKGGYIIGVIPQSIANNGRESKLPTLSLHVADMDERKAQMKKYADVFVVLPGGAGTVDEMFSTIASRAVGEHDKDLILFNPNNYWDGIIAQIHRMEQEHTAHKISLDTLPVAETIEQLTDLLSKKLSK